ncbi:MAG: hypothetical protein AAGJ19_09885 [Myxococcota bacterium]
MNLRKHPLMALGLCTALGAVACGSEDTNGNGSSTNGNGNDLFDMGNGTGNDPVDMGEDLGDTDTGNGTGNGNGNGDMGDDMGNGVADDMGDLGPDELIDLSVEPTTATVELDNTLQLVVTGTFRREGAVSPFSEGVNFGLTMAGIIEVDDDGLVTAIAEGGPVQVLISVDGSPLTATVDVTVVADPCPRGSEGCRCSASTNANSANLAQDDCDMGLTCLPLTAWYDEFRPPNEAPFPITQTADTCVQTCVEDVDCGMGRFCSVNAFNASNLGGALGVCADQVASFEEACSLSLEEDSLVEVDPDGDAIFEEIEQFAPGVLQGCDTGLTCFHHFFIGSISANGGLGTNPNEAVCLPLCGEDADCAGFAGREVCNFVFGDALGVCNDKAPEPGDFALQPSTVSGPNPIVTTFTNGCTDPGQVIDLNGDGALDGAFGLPLCVQVCDTDPLAPVACVFSSGPDDAQQCNPIPDSTVGLCSTECGSVLETSQNDTLCPSDRSCDLNNFVDGNGDPVFSYEICRQSLEPFHELVDIGAAGQVDTMTGDDCFANMLGTDLAACPPKSICFETGGAGNSIPRCVVPCDFVANSTVSEDYCGDVNGAGAVCTDQEQIAAGFGFCSTP